MSPDETEKDELRARFTRWIMVTAQNAQRNYLKKERRGHNIWLINMGMIPNKLCIATDAWTFLSVIKPMILLILSKLFGMKKEKQEIIY